MDRYIKDRYQISLGQILLTSASRSEAEDNLFHKMVNEKVKTWSEIFCSSNGNEVCQSLLNDQVSFKVNFITKSLFFAFIRI